MFKNLFSLALLAVASNAATLVSTQETEQQSIGTDVLADAETFICSKVYDTETLTSWDFTSMQTEADMTKNGYTWNYCKAVDTAGNLAVQADANGQTVAYATNGQKTETTKLVNDVESAQYAEGVQLTQYSTTKCPQDDTKVNSWTTQVWCAEGQANTLIAGPTANQCTVEVTYAGDAGCPTIDLESALTWFGDNTWALGLLYLVVGPLTALFGLRFFPYVAATVISLFTMTTLFVFFVTMSWADETAGFYVCLSIAVIAGVLAGCFIRRQLSVAFGLLGAIGGFFGGLLLLDIITALSGWTEVWAMWTFGIVGGLAGFFAAYKLGKPVINLVTSFIGSYLFTRALTLFFWTEHWPSEAEILSGDITSTLGWQFLVFLLILVAATFGSYKFQAKQEVHEEFEKLDDYSTS